MSWGNKQYHTKYYLILAFKVFKCCLERRLIFSHNNWGKSSDKKALEVYSMPETPNTVSKEHLPNYFSCYYSTVWATKKQVGEQVQRHSS